MDSRRDLEAAYERIMARTSRQPDGCLECSYSLGSHGYVQAWDGVTVVLAHRIVWEHVNGPIPAGMTVDHERCRNRRCVEITHLRLLTNFDNARRNHPDHSWPVNGKCLHGHEHAVHWAPKSEKRKKGYCRECRRVKWARRNLSTEAPAFHPAREEGDLHE